DEGMTGGGGARQDVVAPERGRERARRLGEQFLQTFRRPRRQRSSVHFVAAVSSRLREAARRGLVRRTRPLTSGFVFGWGGSGFAATPPGSRRDCTGPVRNQGRRSPGRASRRPRPPSAPWRLHVRATQTERGPSRS